MFSVWSGMKQDDHSLLVYVHLLNVLLGPVGEAALWYVYIYIYICYATHNILVLHCPFTQFNAFRFTRNYNGEVRESGWKFK